MEAFEFDLGIQSFCFRDSKDNLQVVDCLKKCNIGKVELCGVHADFSDPEGFDSVISLYQKNGVKIVSIGVCTFSNNEQEEKKFFEFAKKTGAKVISACFDINTVPESYRTTERLADQYDVRLAIHNHGGCHWLGSSQMLEHVFKNTSSRIGLCLDTAWALDSGEDPVEMAKKFKGRLYSLHLKDFIFDRAGKPQDVIVGEGNLNLLELLKVLEKNNFNGPAIIEYEGDVENPVPAVKRCVSAILTTLENLG